IRVPIVVVGARTDVPGLPGDEPFVVLVREQLGLPAGRELPTTDLFLDTAGGISRELRDAITAVAPGSSISNEADEAARLRDEPAVGALRTGIAASILVAAAYASLATVVALILGGSARGPENVHLRALGADRRQFVGLVIFEHMPLVLVSVVAGVG